MPIDVRRKSCKRIFTASPFIIAPNGKRPDGTPVTGGTDKPTGCYLSTREWHSPINKGQWYMQQRCGLSEHRFTEKESGREYVLYHFIYVKFKNERTCWDRDRHSGCLWETGFTEGAFWGDENFWLLSRVGVSWSTLYQNHIISCLQDPPKI